MGKAGGGRNYVDPRFISMFSVYNVTFPADETLNYIYTSILSGHLQIFSEDIQQTATPIIQITLELYKVHSFFFLIQIIEIKSIKEILIESSIFS